MKRIFISYRRADSQDTTGRIYDHLASNFGKKSVYTDVDSIPIGSDFVQHIQNAIGGASVVLVIIGPRWTSICDEAGNNRLADPQDVVRLEIEIAIRAGVPIVPVLVQNAEMPTDTELPQSLKPLITLNAATVRPGRDFTSDIRHLKNTIPFRTLKRRVLECLATLVIMTSCGFTLYQYRLPHTIVESDTEKSETKLATTSSEILPPPLRTISRGVPMSLDSPHSKEINQFLRTQNSEFEFVELPLQDSMDYLSQLHEIPIKIDELALYEDGLLPDEPINRVATGLTFHNSLFQVLEPLGLTFVIEQGGLKITTLSAAEVVVQTRFYEVADLTARGLSSPTLANSIRENISHPLDGFDATLKDTLVITTSVGVHNEIERFLFGLRYSKR